jgi:tRNA G18 (ribose-2'-O)-methylase SpoU
VAAEITHPDDPRIADYRELKERHLNSDGRRFVAESERVVRRLIASGWPIRSLLVTPPRLAALGDVLPAVEALGCPVYVTGQGVMDGIAGFHVHRGCLAIGERPAAPAIPADARLIVALEDLVDVDNLGAIVRNAAAFGADALLLSPRCADPFYRKAIRVSLGSVFTLPIVRVAPGGWPQEIVALRERRGFTAIALVLAAGAEPLGELAPPDRTVLLLGAEGPGLSAGAIAACDRRVTIPMSPAADSLNVATAAAIFLYHLTRASGNGGSTRRHGGSEDQR